MTIETIELVLTIALVLDALALIVLIMIQQGKGAGVGAAFGSGASQTMFGSAGASSFLTTLTTWLAVGFFVITFGLAWTARERAQSLGTVGIPDVESVMQEGAGPDSVPVDDDLPALDMQGSGADDTSFQGEVPAAPVDGSDVPAAPSDDVPPSP